MQLYTIGHSNRTAQAFLALLAAQNIAQLIDVRKLPSSRFNPHFNKTALAELLAEQNIQYLHMPALGGKRAPHAHSPNTAFRPEGGLQSYADYMGSPEFQFALQELMELARVKPTAIMCAEAKPEQCHRQLIADALLVRGWQVLHIVSVTELRPHQLHPAAQVGADAQIIYSASKDQLSLL